MRYKLSVLVFIVSCVGLMTALMCGVSCAKFKFYIKQDEKDWSDTLQKERERRSNESGKESFERLNRIYGDSAPQ